MKFVLTLVASLLSLSMFANVYFIDFEKIPGSEKYSEEISFLKENEQYYNHWEAQWSYQVSREYLVDKLKKVYKKLKKLDKKSLERNLALGDVCHYLYNLQEQKYYSKANDFYEKAMEIAPKDYRSYWFQANHYSLAAVPEKSIYSYTKAMDLLPEDVPAAFWEEYMFATAIANMPSSCIYAMDKAKAILGEPSYFESQLGQSMYDRIISLDRDSSYEYTEIWQAGGDEMISFISRPLGMMFLLDSTWNINMYNYVDHNSVVLINPPKAKTPSGEEVNYTIGIIIHAASENDTLENYIQGMINTYPAVNEKELINTYSNMVSYEIKDPTMYENIGGAHMHMLGIERDYPAYAGMKLEKPVDFEFSKTNELSFFTPNSTPDRFSGKIYYAILLDASEDIYDEAFKTFMDFIQKQLVIE